MEMTFSRIRWLRLSDDIPFSKRQLLIIEQAISILEVLSHVQSADHVDALSKWRAEESQ